MSNPKYLRGPLTLRHHNKQLFMPQHIKIRVRERERARELAVQEGSAWGQPSASAHQPPLSATQPDPNHHILPLYNSPSTLLQEASYYYCITCLKNAQN